MTEIPPERAAGARKNDQKKPKITLVRLMCAPRTIDGHEKTQKQAKNRRSGRERNTNFVHNCGLLQFEVNYRIASAIMFKRCRTRINQTFIGFKRLRTCLHVRACFKSLCASCATIFERETHGSEIDKEYYMDHLPALRSKAPPNKGGCSMSRCGYDL